jgi:hypothetical protein
MSIPSSSRRPKSERRSRPSPPAMATPRDASRPRYPG